MKFLVFVTPPSIYHLLSAVITTVHLLTFEDALAISLWNPPISIPPRISNIGAVRTHVY